MLALAVMSNGMLSSCTDDFEDLNTNKTQVDPGDLPFAAQCAEAMNYCYPPHQNMFQFWTNLTIDLYGGYFQTPHGNFTNCDMGENRGHSGGMYENYYLHIFNNTRRNIANLDKQENAGLAGTMRIVQAVGTMQATDAYGPLAYSSIINAESESTYRFDSQQKLYEQMLDDLDKAIAGLQKMDDTEKASLATYDTWGGGDPAIWVQIANTMKLRIALRLSKRESEMAADGYDLKAIATAAAANTLAVSGKDIVVKDQSNELKRMFDWQDCGMNANLVTLMVGMNDPRLPLYMTKNADEIKNEKGEVTPKNSVYCGIRYASGMPQKGSDGSYGYKMSQWVGAYNTPLPIFKAAEAYFLLAEAKLRWNIGSESVKALYEKVLTLGREGIPEAAENAVLNANYLMRRIQGTFQPAFDRICMHEFVLGLEEFKKETGVSALDVAKSLIDRGIHPPTMYFPLIVHEALMLEPTETESRETLDQAAEVFRQLYQLAHTDPEAMRTAPHNAQIGRPDEVQAARNPILRWQA